MKNENPIKGVAFLLLATLSHGMYGIFSRIIGTGFGEFFQIVARSSVLLIFFAVMMMLQKSWKKIDKADYKWFILMIIPGLIALASMFVAFNHLSLGTVLFIYYATSTLASYLLGKLLFGEKLNSIKTASLLLSFLGLYFIFSSSFKLGNMSYLLLASLAGLGAAAWNIVSKKISNKYPVTELLIMDSLLMVIVGLPIALFRHEAVSLPSFTLPWFGILGYSIAAIGSSVFTIRGFKHLQAQIGSLIMLLEPVVGALIGFFAYKEVLTTYSIIGASLILVGVALPNLKIVKQGERE